MDFESSPCHICGLSVRGTPCFSDENDPPFPEDDPLPEYFNELVWFSEACLLCDPDDEFGQILPGLQNSSLKFNYLRSKLQPDTHGVRPRCQASDIEAYPAEPGDKNQYIRWDPDGSYKCGETRDKVVCFSSRYWAFDDRAYALVHSACLEIAKIAFDSSQTAHIRDLRGLFMALRWRQEVPLRCSELHRCGFAPNFTIWTNDFYIPDFEWSEHECPGLDWPGPFPSARANLFYVRILQLHYCNYYADRY